MIQFPFHTKRAGFLTVAVLGLAVLFTAGCKHQAAAPTDQQMTTDIQAKLTAEPALNGQSVQVSVANGVATLNGTVTSDAARVLAGNEAGTIDGVKTVVNNLTVQQAQNTMPEPPPVSTTTPAPKEKPAPRREQRHEAKHSTEAAQQYRPVEPPQQQAPVPAPVAQAPVQQAPPPPSQPVVKDVTLPAGTVIPVRLTETLDTKTAQPNDVFHGSLAGDLRSGGIVAIPRGAPIMGRVVDAKEAAHFKGSSLLTLELTQMSARGQRFTLVTDTFSEEGKGRGKNTATKTGAGAALGAIVGALAGGGKGAAIGGLAGAGAGAGINAATRGEQVVIPTETVINFKLQSPLTVRVTLSPDNGPEAQSDPTLQKRQ
ncbi:MAG TPA: BON domain-containing protein [Terracidiphilus sp.]|nr:BON domain-containing protein [Terracidiphilus sp.]